MITIDSPRFVRASPLVEARRYVDADLRNHARPEQLRWLYDNVLLWLKVLDRIDREVENAIAKDHLALAPLKPLPGEHATSAYLVAKVEQGERLKNRLHFQQILRRRRDEVLAIVGPRQVLESTTRGDVVGVLSRAVAMIEEGAAPDAASLLRAYMQRWSASNTSALEAM